jgi:hypothetical protein
LATDFPRRPQSEDYDLSSWHLSANLGTKAPSEDDGRIRVFERGAPIALIAEWPVVQPGRRVQSPQIVLRTEATAKAKFEATVLSSSARPFPLELDFQIEVTHRQMSWREILDHLYEAIT